MWDGRGTVVVELHAPAALKAAPGDLLDTVLPRSPKLPLPHFTSGLGFLPRASFFGSTSFFTLQSFPYLVNGDAEERSLDRKLAELGLDPRYFTIILHLLTYRWGRLAPRSDPQLYSSIK